MVLEGFVQQAVGCSCWGKGDKVFNLSLSLGSLKASISVDDHLPYQRKGILITNVNVLMLFHMHSQYLQ